MKEHPAGGGGGGGDEEDEKWPAKARGALPSCWAGALSLSLSLQGERLECRPPGRLGRAWGSIAC